MREMEPTITASAKDSMHDELINITVTGLQPKERVTVRARATNERDNTCESVAQYIADDNGNVNLSRDRSMGGSYKGIEPMGLFWSMKPVNTSNKKKRYPRMVKHDVITPLVYTIRLYRGWLKSENEVYQFLESGSLKELSSTTVNRWMKSRDTERIVLDFEKDGIYGTLFIPAGKGPFPGVIVMFGGIPGTLEFQASLLSSHGFATFALIYIGRPGLPKTVETDVLKMEYFEKATTVFLKHPKVDASVGLGVVGKSYAGCLALAMAAMLPNIKCAVWQSGFSHPVYGQLSYKNRTFIKQSHDEYEDSVVTEGNFDRVFYGRRIVRFYKNPFCKELDQSRLPFYEKHDVAYLFIAGLSDDSVPCEHYINQAEIMLKAAKHPNYTLLRYPGTGHLLEPGYSIHHPVTFRSRDDVLVRWGGETVPHCRAQVESWFEEIKFLKSNLRKPHISQL